MSGHQEVNPVEVQGRARQAAEHFRDYLSTFDMAHFRRFRELYEGRGSGEAALVFNTELALRIGELVRSDAAWARYVETEAAAGRRDLDPAVNLWDAFMARHQGEDGSVDCREAIINAARLYRQGSDAAGMVSGILLSGTAEGATVEQVRGILYREVAGEEQRNDFFFRRGYMAVMDAEEESRAMGEMLEAYRISTPMLAADIFDCYRRTAQLDDAARDSAVAELSERYEAPFVEMFMQLRDQLGIEGMDAGQIADYIVRDPERFDALRQARSVTITSALEGISRIYSSLAEDSSEARAEELARQYGTELVGMILRRVRMAAVPSLEDVSSVSPYEVDGRIHDTMLNRFTNILTIEVEGGASRERRARAIAGALAERFRIDEASAGHMMRALLDAYNALGRIRDREDRSRAELAFEEWLRGLSQRQGASIARAAASAIRERSMELPYRGVLDAFEAWRESRREARGRTADDMYPERIRRADLSSMYADFEASPSGRALEDMQSRLAYLRARLGELEGERGGQRSEEINQEIEAFTTWFRGLGIEVDGPEEGVRRLAAGMMVIERQYSESLGERSGLLRTLASVESNQALSLIYRRYLLLIDLATLRLFTEVDPEAGNFRMRIGQIMRTRMSAEEIDRARAQWASDYYAPFGPSAEDVERRPLDAARYSHVAELSRIAAVPFGAYLDAVSEGGIGSERERQLVLETVMRIYSVQPMLIAGYFNAIANLALICANSPEIFMQAMVSLSARIDAETAPVASGVGEMQPVNARRIVNTLDAAFGQIAGLQRATLTEYTRVELMDDAIEVDDQPPHAITHRPPGYAPRLLPPETDAGTRYPPYPFPPHIATPTIQSLFGEGGVLTGSYMNPEAEGRVMMPNMSATRIESPAGQVGETMRASMFPEHLRVGIPGEIPGSRIQVLSVRRLMHALEIAFIPTLRPEYSIRPIGGGGGGGVRGREAEGDWSYEGAFLGNLLTSTGGIAAGGYIGEDTTFAGATAVAVPVGFLRHVPLVGGRGVQDIGIDSLTGGYEELDDGTERILARAIATRWNPDNPSQILVSVNREQRAVVTGETEGGEETTEERAFMTDRLFFVDRNGQVFELLGGTNDFVEGLNFIAGYADQTLRTPVTYAWNVEPTIQRGGGAIAWDIGNTSLMAHFQEVPFLLPEGEPQPMLMQWTPGLAHTTRPPGEREESQTYQITLPGSMLRLRAGADGEEESDYIMQDASMRVINRQGDHGAWEVRAGFGLGHAEGQDELGRGGMIGRGGVFARVQRPRWRAGGGAFYEGGASDTYAMALLGQSDEAVEYLQSLHRIGATLYGSREIGSRWMLGGLAHIVAQLREEQESGTSFDNIFYRFMGVLRYLDTAMTFDVRRMERLDTMLTDYEQLGREVNADPSRAAELLEEFRETYGSTVRELLDRYSIGVTVTDRMTLEATVVATESEGRWTSQEMEEVQGRFLFTWRTGFWRAYASVPVPRRLEIGEGEEGEAPERRIGIAGMGIGGDLMHGFWMQRAALDFGILITAEEEESGDTGGYRATGLYGQLTVQLFSNVLEDSRNYRELVRNYGDYEDRIRDGDFGRIPESVRETVAARLRAIEGFDGGLLSEIESGENDLRLEEADVDEILDALYRGWYEPGMAAVEQRFHGHWRSYVAASGYWYGGGEYSLDLGAFVECVDRFRGYVIASTRGELADAGVFAGMDFEFGRVRIGVMGGGAFGERDGVGVAGSFGVDVGTRSLPVELTLTGYGRSSRMPEYVWPIEGQFEEHEGNPEFGGMFTITIGQGAEIRPGTTPPPMQALRR